MSCNYEFMGKLYTKEQLTQLLQDKGIQNKINVLLNKNEFSNMSYSPDEEISGELDEDFFSDFATNEDIDLILPYDQLVKFKAGLLKDLKNRIANLKGVIDKETNKQSIKEKTKLLEQLQERANTLDQEMHNERNAGEASLKKFKFQVARDLERVKQLLDPSGRFIDDYENLNEAKKIINFYKSMELVKGKVDVTKQSFSMHPFFNLEEILDSNGNPILGEEIVSFFNNTAQGFKNLESAYDKRQEGLIENIFNANPKIQKLYGDMSYDQITESTGDATWVDMFVMEANRGIWSKNGLIPQVALEIIQDLESENSSENTRFIEKHDKLLPKVQDKLKQLQQTIGKNVSFDIFFQKALGRNTGKFVNRYSQDYFDKLSSVMYKFRQSMLNAQGFLTDGELDPEDTETRKKSIASAYQEKQQWFRENTMMFDVRKLPEIQQLFPEFSTMFKDDGSKHKQELINEIGEIGYQEELQKQIQEIKKFIAWRDSTQEIYLEQQNVESLADLTEEQLNDLKMSINSQNPFYSAENFYDNTVTKVGKEIVKHTMNYNVTIPRRYVAEVKKSVDGKVLNIIPTGQPTGFYDENYETIEENPELKEYYNLIKDRMEVIASRFPEEVREKIFSNSLPMVRKGVAEILADPNVSFLQKISKVFKNWYEQIKQGFGVNMEESITYDNLDLISNRAEPRVSTSFLNNNKSRIDQKFNIELKKMNNILKNNGLPLRLNRHTELLTASLPYPAMKILADKLGIPATTKAFESRFGSRIKPADILYKTILSDTVEQHSLDLPKIIKYYSIMGAEYNARQQALPLINSLREHYTQIKTYAKTTQGEFIRDKDGKMIPTGLRNRANTQFESWFNRVILGNTKNQEWGVVDKYSLEERKNIAERLKAFTKGRILTEDERKQKKDLNELIDEVNKEISKLENNPNLKSDEMLQDQLEKVLKEKKDLTTQRESLGKLFAGSAVVDHILNYVRYLGLGWKISSMVTNFIEGQIANMTIAATGDYFDPKHFYRATHIVRGSMVKNATLGKLATDGSRKTRIFADRFDILQDSNNELQKASIKTPLNYMGAVSPYMGNKRTEYLNQTPIMVAIMLDTEITGKNGQKSSLWDALKPDGTLKPEFATNENVQAWEEGTGEKAREFKKKVSNAIVTAHGNYDKLRGLMAKESTAGKILLMFKTWMGSQLYQRFAVEQADLTTSDTKYKGRYRSHTKASGGLQGAIYGFAFAGIPGAAIGYAGGAVLAQYLSKTKSDAGLLETLKESFFLLKALTRKMVATPINYFNVVTGKEVIKEYSNFESLKGSNFTERDMKNMRGLVAEMSMTLTLVLLGMIVKQQLWDDDDEDDSPKRIQHNILMNYIAQLIGSSTSYLYAPSIVESYSSTGFAMFLDNTGKVITAFQDYLDNNDISLDKSNAGESKLLTAIEKVTLPALMRDDMLGFGTLSKRQFKPQFYDDWFWDSEKKANRIIDQQRIVVRKKLEDEGLDKKEIDRFLDKTLKRLKDIKDPTSRTATESVKEEKEKLSAEEKMRRKLLKEQLRKEIEEEKEEDTEEK